MRASGLSRRQARSKQRILTQPEPAKVRESRDAIVLKEAHVFLLAAESGDVPMVRPEACGLCAHDCRHLDGWTLRLNGQPPVMLSGIGVRSFEAHHHVTNPELPPVDGGAPIPRNTLAIRRRRLIRGAVLHERLGIAARLRPNVDAALAWIDGAGDADGDGYVDYAGKYGKRMVNQGWKDSGTAIVNADGSLATPPIALSEVQAYVSRAWRDLVPLMRALGDAATANRLERRAEDLRQRFERDFWDERLGCYVLARQAGGRPAAVVTSKAGHVLWSGIASDAHAARVAERLMVRDMFSGWGVRTLSSEATAYNPMSYHLGSVWPHDNAIIVGGFRRYGVDDAATRLFDAVLDAATHFRNYRLPELYCGYERGESEDRPVRYPVACSPQAWAAGALPHALWQLLGLEADALARRLHVVRPRLPGWVDWLELRDVTAGDAKVDLAFSRRGRDGRVDVDAAVRDGEVDVQVTEEPPVPDALDAA